MRKTAVRHHVITTCYQPVRSLFLYDFFNENPTFDGANLNFVNVENNWFSVETVCHLGKNLQTTLEIRTVALVATPV